MATALRRLESDLARAADLEIHLERPGNPEHGDYATNAALQAAPVRRRPPLEIAEELREAAAGVQGVKSASVAAPGFLNLELDATWYGEALAEILEQGDGYGGGSADRPERVQVELVSANPTGPLTVGSGRNGAYGDSVARLLAFAGHEVATEHYVNDVGGQIDVFRRSVEARARGGEPPEEGYVGEYVSRLAAAGGDPVEHMLGEIRKTLERFRVRVDAWVRESELDAEIAAAVEELGEWAYEKDGALWLRTTKLEDEKDRVLIRSDGRPAYLGRDAVHTRWKLAQGFERLIYVLGADHHGYIKRLQALAAGYGRDPDVVEVLLYQLVHLTERGEARKVSKRRGDVVLLDELMAEIGVDAARWYLVSRGPEQAIEIDVDLAGERSEKNPVYYVQYAHARIAGILRNAGEAAADPEPRGEPAREERELVKRLVEFPQVVAEATERRGPHALPYYAVRVADDFHRFYHHHRVLESEEEAFRLGLCRATKAVIARALDLVGVDAPERM